ncbi:Hypothetical protein NTJ_15800 [Nesidiocoris tenuis]|uniref:Uncharacterized protein n=1 Tax=Nesidiocoris tenuis TaxID=355587 RepID=A0ABN7BF64_9HEMI|nr:Hypothetical protein NTJ_15800 [Nesidiocoris tenuis]
MEKVRDILSDVLDSVISSAAEDEGRYDMPSSSPSYFNLTNYESKCVVSFDENDASARDSEDGAGDGNHLDGAWESVFSDDSTLQNKTIYVTHRHFLQQSSENILDLEPHEMCQDWDEFEDKRRKVYWSNCGLMQERYVHSLFTDPETPDSARPTIARVDSDEMFSKCDVPHVSAIVRSRRATSRNLSALKFRRCREQPSRADKLRKMIWITKNLPAVFKRLTRSKYES